MTLYALNEQQKNWLLRQMRIGPGNGSLSDSFKEAVPNFLFRNDSSEAVPPYACMRVTGVEEVVPGRFGFVITKPTTATGLFVFNNRHEIELNGIGVCHPGPAVQAATDASISNGTDLGVSGWELSATGEQVLKATAYGPIDEETAFVHVSKMLGGLFEVALTKTGGSQGTTTAKPTYTYTVADVDAETLETVFDPTSTNGSCFVRHIGFMTEATCGIATYRKSDGALKILWCNEQSITEACV